MTRLVPTVVALSLIVAAPARAAAPMLPQVYVDTTYPTQTGRTLSVASGGDLQAAIDMAQPGDTISLAAGATFTGSFRLPAKTGPGWIVIRSSAPDAMLPPPGTRIDPSFASVLPKIVSATGLSALATDFGAHHYRFVGVEIATSWSVTTGTHYNVIELGFSAAGAAATQTSELPHDLTFDRTYVHGTKTGNVRRGLMLNGIRIAVIDSYFADFHEVGADSQAIGGFNGAGPFKIVNNYLEGSGENVIFGGADPSIQNLVPADIEFRCNHVFKPLSWRVGDPSYAGTPWTVKNLFELKNARRVLVEGNRFENSWGMAQVGFALLVTPRNQDGTANWCGVEDVTFRHNRILHAAGGFNVSGTDDLHSSFQTARILIQNNLLDDINGTTWNGDGRLFQVLNSHGPAPLNTPGGTIDVTIEHNTGAANLTFVTMGDSTMTADQHVGFAFQNNLVAHAMYGLIGSGQGDGNPTLTTYARAPYVVTKNAIYGGGSASSYPANNFFPATIADVGFVNAAAGDYHLTATSPYKNAGTDGKDVGVDLDALLAASQCAPSTAPPDGGAGRDGGAFDGGPHGGGGSPPGCGCALGARGEQTSGGVLALVLALVLAVGFGLGGRHLTHSNRPELPTELAQLDAAAPRIRNANRSVPPAPASTSSS